MPNETEDYNNAVRAALPSGMTFSGDRYRYNNHSFSPYKLAAWYYYYILRTGGAFSPSSLFSAGEQGVWYDPSDLTTLFTDSAGTTPVTATGQTVGKMLDKSGRGNHATQATTASKPTYGINPITGTRNLLTRTEEFDNAAWAKQNTTVTANAGTAPDGTATADKLINTSAAASHYVSQLDIPAGTYSWSCYMKAAEFSRGAIYLFDGGFNLNAIFDLSSGTVSSSGSASTASIVSVGDGWYRCRVSGAVAPSGGGAIRISANMGGGFTESTAGNGTSGILIWGAQLEVGSTATAYQRVTDQYNVTEAGVASAHYLRFDGSDDSMVTNTITPNIDKAQVFAGVRKLSDVAGHIAGGDGNTAGQFEILSGGWAFGANRYGAGFFTNVLAQIDSPANFTSPRTDVLSWRFDTSGATGPDKAKLNVNSASQTLTIAGLPAGANFGSFAHVIGRRANATLPFNGQLYSLIVRFGANLTDGQITLTETYVNGKTGAYT